MDKKIECKKEKFIKILIVELEDLDKDIKLLIDESCDKHSHEQISDYVYLENLAVLQNELFGVEGFIDEIKNINADEFESVEELADNLINQLINRIHEKGLVHSIKVLVERKIKKVASFVVDH